MHVPTRIQHEINAKREDDRKYLRFFLSESVNEIQK